MDDDMLNCTDATKTYAELKDHLVLREEDFDGQDVVEVVEGQWRKDGPDRWRFWRYPAPEQERYPDPDEDLTPQ